MQRFAVKKHGLVYNLLGLLYTALREIREMITKIMPKPREKETVIPVLTPSQVSNVATASDKSQASTPQPPVKNPDFVLVWNHSINASTTQKAFERRSVFEYNLEEEGLILEWGTSKATPELHVVKIFAPLEVLKRYSEILKLRLPMKEYIANTAKPLKSETRFSRSVDSIKKSSLWMQECCLSFGRVFRLDEPSFTKYRRRLTGVFSRDRAYLFDLDESNVDEVFPLCVRARIVQFILNRTPYKSGEELERDAFAFGCERLVKQDVYEAAYPLHDGSVTGPECTRKLLHDNWGTLNLNTCFKAQPLDAIKDYFGINIAIYFAWLGFYTRMLLLAAFVGIAAFLYGSVTVESDQFVVDVCNEQLDITMCPLCDGRCGYWKLDDKCGYAKIAYIFDNEFSFVFALFMSVWAVTFLELWKRYTARITYHWDLTTFDLKKDFNPRPEYVAELKKIYPEGIQPSTNVRQSEEVGNDKRRFDFELELPFWSRILPFRVLSYVTVLFLVVLALAAVAGVIMYRMWFTVFLYVHVDEDTIGFELQKIIISVTAAFLNLTFIFIFGKLYKQIALVLTQMEYPRTLLEFEASYTLKVYVLQFINNYSSIFYIAFFKGAYVGAPNKYHKVHIHGVHGGARQEECGLGCMPELCIQLAVIMIGKQAKNVIVGATIPCFLRSLRKLKKTPKVAEKNLGSDSEELATPQWAQDYDLLSWGNYFLTDEYLDMVLQFGFVTIFVAAFPLAPFFALLNNLLEIRIDANKMLTHYKRPVGFRAKGIGVWSDIIDGVVKIAVISNACIIALTSNFIPKFVYRFFLLSRKDPRYGTLVGYLNSTLTVFDTNDLEARPNSAVLAKLGNSRYCSFQTYRHNYNVADQTLKYTFRLEHWQIWFAKVIFILLYENFVNVIIGFVSWMIPDVPSKLRAKIQREERLVNELVVKAEQKRARKSLPHRHSPTVAQHKQGMMRGNTKVSSASSQKVKTPYYSSTTTTDGGK